MFREELVRNKREGNGSGNGLLKLSVTWVFTVTTCINGYVPFVYAYFFPFSSFSPRTYLVQMTFRSVKHWVRPLKSGHGI